MIEQWRVYEKAPDYEVSDLGNVRRCTPGKHTYVGRPLQGHNNRGYSRILVRVNGQLAKFSVHRMVVETFIGPIPGDKQINHKNGIRNDNRVCNLEIVTCRENHIHAFRMLGRKPPPKECRPKGEQHPNSTMTAEKVREIRRLYALGGMRQADIAAQFQTTQSNVHLIVARKNWRHVI